MLYINDKPEEPYFSITMLGTTTSFSRTAFYAYYGMLFAFWFFFIIMTFVMYSQSDDTNFAASGIVMILLTPVLWGVVVYRLHAYRQRMEKS